MNLPNKLTILRICLIPFFIFFLLVNCTIHRFLIANLIFLLAAFTDHLDGKIARKYNMITNFGKFADPLADKILIISAFICFVDLGFINVVAVIIIIFREFVVTSIRLIAAPTGKIIEANNWGKFKTVSQIITIILIILFQYILELISQGILFSKILNEKFTFSIFENVFYISSNILIWISTIFTIISGLIYFLENKKLFLESK